MSVSNLRRAPSCFVKDFGNQSRHKMCSCGCPEEKTTSKSCSLKTQTGGTNNNNTFCVSSYSSEQNIKSKSHFHFEYSEDASQKPAAASLSSIQVFLMMSTDSDNWVNLITRSRSPRPEISQADNTYPHQTIQGSQIPASTPMMFGCIDLPWIPATTGKVVCTSAYHLQVQQIGSGPAAAYHTRFQLQTRRGVQGMVGTTKLYQSALENLPVGHWRKSLSGQPVLEKEEKTEENFQMENQWLALLHQLLGFQVRCGGVIRKLGKSQSPRLPFNFCTQGGMSWKFKKLETCKVRKSKATLPTFPCRGGGCNLETQEVVKAESTLLSFRLCTLGRGVLASQKLRKLEANNPTFTNGGESV